VAVALLAMLMLPMPIGSAERIFADTLLVALILLVLLYIRVDRGVRGELEQKLDGMEKQLAEAESFSESVLDGVPDPAIMIDKDFTVSAINKEAIRSFNGDAAAAATMPCYRALHGRDTPCDPGEHPCVLTTGESCKHLHKQVDADGTERLIELRATPLYDENGAITGAVEVLHNLNEQERMALRLQRAREDAETAHAARARFVATMSHEVRTPLNAVLGMTDLLRLTSLTRKQKSYVQIMESSSNMLLSLVDNMIDFATIESGKLELKSDSFYVTDLLERVLEIMGYQAYSKGIELAGATDYEPDMQISGDFNRLQQIMINLVGNAIKFTESGGVSLRAEVAKRESPQWAQLRFEVEDTGIGIREEDREIIFSPFEQRMDQPLAEIGTGLGLAISKQYVEFMGGHIGVTSEPGKGSVFHFEIPVELLPLSKDISTELQRGRVMGLAEGQQCYRL